MSFKKNEDSTFTELLDNISKAKDLSNVSEEFFINSSDKIGFLLADRYKGIKTNQVRRIFNELNKAKMDLERSNSINPRELAMQLRPKLAYTFGRIGSPQTKELFQVLDTMLKKINPDKDKGKDDFEKFYRFFEAILAYHKYYGGQ